MLNYKSLKTINKNIFGIESNLAITPYSTLTGIVHWVK